MINLGRDLRTMIRNQEAAKWDTVGRFQHEIRGSVVGIWGYGGIGRETARLAKALGLTVHVLTRRDVGPRGEVFSVPGTGDPEDLTAAQAAAIIQGDGLTATLAGFRGIPQNSNSADYTLVAADAGKHILHPSGDANARTFTIPANASVAFPVGTTVTVVNQTSQVVSIAITTDTLTLANSTTTGTRSLAQNGVATAIKVASTSWIISGAGLT